jgi:hypothetical protein
MRDGRPATFAPPKTQQDYHPWEYEFQQVRKVEESGQITGSGQFWRVFTPNVETRARAILIDTWLF